MKVNKILGALIACLQCYRMTSIIDTCEPQAHWQMVLVSPKKRMKANHSETMKGHRIKKYTTIRWKE